MADDGTPEIGEFGLLRNEISALANVAEETAKSLESIKDTLIPQVNQVLARYDVWKEQVDATLESHKVEFDKLRNENKARDKVLYTVLTFAFIACILFPIVLTKFAHH